MVTSAQFPGGTAVSGLAVYDWATQDGLCGGSPHVHTVCTEAYVVVGGTGSLQTLTRAGFQETPLRAGSVVWFTPGTIHRAVNTDGSLRVVVVMANAGLPEAGDAVLTFPPEILGDPQTYRAAASLGLSAASGAADTSALSDASEDPDAAVAEAARRRRDLAISGFLRLRQCAQDDDFAPLEAFYAQAGELVRERVGQWRAIVDQGPAAALRRTQQQLDALAAGRIDHLLEAGLRAEQAPAPEDRTWGMCGRLDTYRTESHQPEAMG
jgi:mannose-6-phosphate isomerase-like protein (cupin superfamily)